jgi:glycosyltransferase involved in cell wall biosynthesis
MDRILFVLNDFPYPPHDGGSVDTWNLILSLKQLGFALDIIATVKSRPKQEDADVVQAIAGRLLILERDRGIASALAVSPFQVRSRKALKNIALTETYEAVLLKTEYVAAILDNLDLNAKVRVLRVENNEARFCKELSKSAGRMGERCFQRVESLKFERFSPQIKSKCDLLWFISDQERREHIQKHPEDSAKAVFLPADPGVKSMLPYFGRGSEALFVGSLTLPFNVEGLEWYVEHVHPSLSKLPGYSLTVAGRTGGASLPSVHKLLQLHSNISFYADPEDLGGLYKRAAVFVNPVLRGAGVKVKTIHALHAGVPVVSTSVGMEGTGFIDRKHLLVADSADDFVRAVTVLLGDKLMAEGLVHSAQSFLAENYDNHRNITESLSRVLAANASVGSLS